MRNISLWGVWGVCQPLTWTDNQTRDCPQATDWICCFDLAFCSLFIYVWIGKLSVFSSYKALLQCSVQLKDFFTISVQHSAPDIAFFSSFSFWAKQSRIWTFAGCIWSDSVGSGETFMQGKAAVCVLLLTLVSYKTLGIGTRDKRNVWVWERQIFFLLVVFSVSFFLFFFFCFLFFLSNLISCQELKQKWRTGAFYLGSHLG